MRFRTSQRTGIVSFTQKQYAFPYLMSNESIAFYCSVDIMSKKLDPENLGIILMNAFLDEFFPEEKRSTPDTFDLMHYNGIPGSNIDNKVSELKQFSQI